jgi:hypothetical protein
MGFSLYYRVQAKKAIHLSIIENTLFKNGGTWFEWLADMRDRRDMSHYLKGRWY